MVTLNMDPRTEEGFFADRINKLRLQTLQLLKKLEEEVDTVAVTWPFFECVKRFEFRAFVH
jgi:hypothetical protein